MRFKLGISAKQEHSELKTIDEDAPIIQTVHYWFHLFKKGEKNLCHEFEPNFLKLLR